MPHDDVFRVWRRDEKLAADQFVDGRAEDVENGFCARIGYELFDVNPVKECRILDLVSK
jgi:hypothetical protein